MSWLDYFRRWASKYDREVEAYGYSPEKLLKPFRHLIGKRKRGLDVGCGTGKSLEAVAKFCREVVGVEPVEKMARRAEAKGFKVLRMKGEDIGRLGRSGSVGPVDFVSFFASMDYMDAGRVAEGVAEVLADGGMVFLTVEPENEERVVRAFGERGFRAVKRGARKAYEKQTYVCLLLRKTVK